MTGFDAIVRLLAEVAVEEAFNHEGGGPMPEQLETGRVALEQFSYDPITRTFRYVATGARWRASGVDAAVGLVRHEGEVMKASVWFKRYAGRAR